MTIEVKQLGGTKLSTAVSPGTTIRQLKEEIEKLWDIPWYKQRLTQQEPGRSVLILQDKKTLASYGIFYNTTLVLLQAEPQMMEIFVKDEKGRTTTYTVKPTTTVRELKNEIQAKTGVPAGEQRLTDGSQDLQDQHMLEHYNIQPKSTIFMLLRLRGGAAPQHSPFPAC